jgi:hypothetical protein
MNYQNWNQAKTQTHEEKARDGKMIFNQPRCGRELARAGHRCLVALKANNPQLAGVPAELYRHVVEAVQGLQGARFSRQEEGFYGAVRNLEQALMALIDSKHEPLDLKWITGTHVHDRTRALLEERQKASSLLTIPNSQITLTQGNAYDRQGSIFGYESAQKVPSLDTLRATLNRLHFEAIKEFLESFAGDLPAEVPEDPNNKMDTATFKGYQRFN